MNNEIKIIEQIEIGAITCNYGQIKESLNEALKKYDQTLFKFDNETDFLVFAKKSKAQLNNVAEAIDTKRKQIKKIYCEPLLEFEKEFKEMVQSVSRVSEDLNNSIKKIEEKNKKIDSNDLYVVAFEVTTNLENMKKIIDFIKENKIKSVEINPMKKIERGE